MGDSCSRTAKVRTRSCDVVILLLLDVGLGHAFPTRSRVGRVVGIMGISSRFHETSPLPGKPLGIRHQMLEQCNGDYR